MKILFTSTQFATFINEDLSLLRKHFDVDHLITRGLLAPFAVFTHMRGTAVALTWFATVYAFFVVVLAGLSGKRSVVVIGGADASREPAINYGIWLSPWKSVLVGWTMRHAHRLLVVDPFFKEDIVRLARYDGRNIEYVPTGYDSLRWHPNGEKEPFVLTVAGCHDRDRMKKKGLDLLFSAAREIPETRFVVIGVREHLLESARKEAPANVEIVPFLEQDGLLVYYQKAKVYCQPSYTEGLPNSICEAMLCSCVPVGTRVGGIPTAIGDCGFLVPYGDVQKLADAILKALQAPDSLGASARERIAREFTLKRREEALVRILNEAAK